MTTDKKSGIDLFKVALPICVVVAVWGIVAPASLAEAAKDITSVAFRALDWFFMAVVTGFLLLCLLLAFSKVGKIRLGKDDDEPEFSTFSWLAMLFAAGMGSGLVFWGVAEPITHLTGAPGVSANMAASARHAMLITNFHWGLHAWAVYCIGALVLAYFGFRKGRPYLPGAPLRSTFEGSWVGPAANIADLVAILAVAFGVAGSIGMGIFQLQTGLHVLTGISADSVVVQLVILGALVISYMTSAATSLDKGIKWLSNINMSLAILLLLFMLFVGPTGYLLRIFVAALGDYVTNVVPLSLQLYPHQDVGGWLHGWTLTYFFWWIAWAPFVGVFIARISRGRTIREFVLGVLLAPTSFSILWFAVFGGTGFFEELHGLGGIQALVREDVTVALFSMFDRMPLTKILSLITITLVFIFLVTSVDSATFVLGMLTSRGSLDPSTKRKLSWGITLGALGAALMFSRNVAAVRAVAVLGAIPFTLIMILQVAAFLRSVREDQS